MNDMGERLQGKAIHLVAPAVLLVAMVLLIQLGIERDAASDERYSGAVLNFAGWALFVSALLATVVAFWSRFMPKSASPRVVVIAYVLAVLAGLAVAVAVMNLA